MEEESKNWDFTFEACVELLVEIWYDKTPAK